MTRPPTEDETELQRAVREGEEAFENWTEPQPRPVIGADVIKALVLDANAVSGVQIHGASITGGTLDLRGARGAFGGPCRALILRDCVLEQRNGDSWASHAGIDASHSHLQRLSLVDCQTDGIELSSAVIVGDLDLDGLRPLRNTCWVKAQGVRVGGSLTARQANLSIPRHRGTPEDPSKPTSADGSSVDVDDRFGLDLEDAQISGPLTLGPKFTSLGGIRVRGATIDGTLYIDASAAPLERLDATTLRVGGDLTLSGSMSEANLSGSIIDGQVTIGDVTNYGDQEKDAKNGDQEKDAPLYLTSLNVGEPVLNLADSRAGRGLRVTRVVTPIFPVKIDWSEPIRIRTFQLACFPGWKLAEALFKPTSGSGLAMLAFLHRPKEQEDDPDPVVVLDGKAAPIYTLGDQDVLEITSREQAVEYLTLFCTHLWGDGGAFVVLPGSVEARPREDGKGWKGAAEIAYAAYHFKTELWIKLNGEVKMLTDEHIGKPPPSPRPLYASPIRWFEANDSDWPVPPPLGPTSAWTDENEGERDRIGEALRKTEGALGHPAELSWPDGWTRPQIDLKGLRVSRLDDEDGKRWFGGKHGGQDAEFDKLLTEEESARPTLWRRLSRWFGRNDGGKDADCARPTLRLRLSGFEYDRISDWSAPQRAPTSLEEAEELSRTQSQQPEKSAKEASEEPEPSLGRRIRSFFLPDPPERLRARRYWLRSQYETHRPSQDDYRPQPYEQLARVWRAAGHLKNADDITIDKLTLEKMKLKLSRPDEKSSWTKFWHRAAQFGARPIRWFFGFGLKPWWATGTLVGFWVLGLALFLAFASAGVMKVESSAVATAVKDGESVVFEEAPAGADDEEIPCGDHINVFVYPLDVMIPLLDLHQESRCDVSMENSVLGAVKGLYAILGWLIISGFVLTWSGVVRRQTER